MDTRPAVTGVTGTPGASRAGAARRGFEGKATRTAGASAPRNGSAAAAGRRTRDGGRPATAAVPAGPATVARVSSRIDLDTRGGKVGGDTIRRYGAAHER
ncbi:hypothetical protein Val02_66280 [Virgisporangium aliadipatigenens]|uniref:Uncharacterized protein n=1 Tax=Virgisporangium aliadipatigenens TaxID=741659 RepID=A0A8J3YSB8_9ACTN|nr:hypothetical protein Val02_66280 [Virgisporangium aliadipatigenens]